MRWRIPLLLLLVTGTALGSSPNNMTIAAAEDISKYEPKENRKYLRYLTSYGVKNTRQDIFEKVQTFHVNQLSRNRLFYHPLKVTPVLYRIDLRNYRWKAETWEKLYGVEPHFHEQPLTPLPETLINAQLPAKVEQDVVEEKEVKVEKPWPGGVWEGGGPEQGKYFPPWSFQDPGSREEVCPRVRLRFR